MFTVDLYLEMHVHSITANAGYFEYRHRSQCFLVAKCIGGCKTCLCLSQCCLSRWVQHSTVMQSMQEQLPGLSAGLWGLQLFKGGNEA